jgi:hypothetical protein
MAEEKSYDLPKSSKRGTKCRVSQKPLVQRTQGTRVKQVAK